MEPAPFDDQVDEFLERPVFLGCGVGPEPLEPEPVALTGLTWETVMARTRDAVASL